MSIVASSCLACLHRNVCKKTEDYKKFRNEFPLITTHSHREDNEIFMKSMREEASDICVDINIKCRDFLIDTTALCGSTVDL